MKKGHQGVGLTHSKQGSWLTMHVMVVPGTQLNTILIDWRNVLQGPISADLHCLYRRWLE